jgi:hypothetical protein
MVLRSEKSIVSLVASVGLIACLALQGVQAFIFAPLAGAEGSYLLAVLGLFLFVACLAVLSFLNMNRSAALGAIAYALFFTWLWWRFICKGVFIQSDFNWLELPALSLAACICARSAASAPKPARS